MAQNDNTKKNREFKPCYQCSKPAEVLGWEPAHWIYCRKCSPAQSQRLKFKTLEALREEGMDVGIWGD